MGGFVGSVGNILKSFGSILELSETNIESLGEILRLKNQGRYVTVIVTTYCNEIVT